MGLIKIDIPPIEYSILLDGSITIDNLLSGMFFKENNRTKIIVGLNAYHSDEDGAPVVSEFEIAGVTYDSAKQAGQVKFAYKVNFTFACSDKSATTNHYETSNFHIVSDAEQATLKLFIHDKIERNTVNEF
jgi:hypothetical protein